MSSDQARNAPRQLRTVSYRNWARNDFYLCLIKITSVLSRLPLSLHSVPTASPCQIHALSCSQTPCFAACFLGSTMGRLCCSYPLPDPLVFMISRRKRETPQAPLARSPLLTPPDLVFPCAALSEPL